MTLPDYPSSFLVVGVGALIAWRIYARVKRLVGRQRLSRIRPWITLAIFSALAVLVATATVGSAGSIGSLVGGLTIGILLGGHGIRLTKFDVTVSGVYYTPNLHLGIALSLLFIGRLVFRVAQIYLATGQWADPLRGLMQGSLTLLLFGVMAGYYVWYAVGLLRWSKPVSGILRGEGDA